MLPSLPSQSRCGHPHAFSFSPFCYPFFLALMIPPPHPLSLSRLAYLPLGICTPPCLSAGYWTGFFFLRSGRTNHPTPPWSPHFPGFSLCLHCGDASQQWHLFRDLAGGTHKNQGGRRGKNSVGVHNNQSEVRRHMLPSPPGSEIQTDLPRPHK